MKLHETQLQGIKKMLRWFYFESRKKPWFALAGPGGTGKSSIVYYFIQSLNLPRFSKILYVSITGKAALVLRSMGNDANTIHRTFYNNYTTKEGLVRFAPKKKLAEDIALIIVDEFSMVSQRVMDDILRYRVPTIFLGDTFQLSSVMSRPNIFMLRPEMIDYHLTVVFRQKEGSNLLDIATQSRFGEYIKYQKHEDALVTDFDKIYDNLDYYDTILCWKNRNRRNLNQIVRKRNGCYNSIYPQKDEKIVVLKNNYHYEMNYKDIGISPVNGLICDALSDSIVNKDNIELDAIPEFIHFDVDFSKDNDCFNLSMYKEFFLQYYNPAVTSPDFHKIRKETPDLYQKYICADFGYTLSIHKSQGSTINKVLLVEDFEETHKDNYNRLMYVGITRAKEHITIARNFNPSRYL